LYICVEGSTACLMLATEAIQADDTTFLYQLYCSTRADEIAAWGWTATQAEPFLRMQFDAQRRGYALQTPGAENCIVRVGDEDAGRVLVDRSGDEFLLVDIALLPQFRGAGIGTRLIRWLQAKAASAGVRIRLHVERSNRALRLYDRLGFVEAADDGVYLEMIWRPHAAIAGHVGG
jgi:ribosomal protein S18 acetylase RimI-like enzyme